MLVVSSRSSPSSLTHTEDVQVRVLFLDYLLCFGGFDHGTSILYSNMDGSFGVLESSDSHFRLPEIGFHLSGHGATDLVRVSIGTRVVDSNVAVSITTSCFPG